jgi:probable rRNA maturation factor
MTARPSLHVEVNVEDHFFNASSSNSPNLSEASTDEATPSPIAPTTWETWFRTWLDALQPNLSRNQAYELSLRLTDDAEIQQFNAQYRQKDQPTDVLAFAALEAELPLSELMQAEPVYLGDIVISVETAQTQAQQQGHSLTQELAWLAAHALLHLLGWDHPDESSLLNMLQQQEALLQTIGLSSGYYQVELLVP